MRHFLEGSLQSGHSIRWDETVLLANCFTQLATGKNPKNEHDWLEKQPSEDKSPIKNGDFFHCQVSFLEGISQNEGDVFVQHI